MTFKPFRLGSAKVFLPKKTNTQLANNAVSSLVFSASAVTPSDKVNNEVVSDLDTTAQYYFRLAPIGEDRTNGGITSTLPTPQSGPVTVSAGQSITLHIPASGISSVSNLSSAMAMLVWMKKNGGDWKKQGYGYIDADNGFIYSVVTEPLTSAQTYTSAQLDSTTNDPDDLGDRTPYVISYVQLSPKAADGLQINRNPSTVNVSPDTGPDVSFVTSRGAALQFRLLSNGMKEIVNANAGTFSQISINGKTVKQAQMSMQTATALLTGNLPFKIVYPADQSRASEIKLFLNCVAQSQSGNQEQWGRDNVAAVTYNINMASFDTYFLDVPTEVGYLIY